MLPHISSALPGCEVVLYFLFHTALLWPFLHTSNNTVHKYKILIEAVLYIHI